MMAPMSGTHEFSDDARNADVLVYVNGAIVHRAQATVSVFDSAFLVGDGVWESFRLHNGRLAFVAEHLDRLRANLRALDYADVDGAFLVAEVERTLAANGMTGSGVHVRMMVSRGNKRSPSQDPRANVGGPNVVIIPEYKVPSRGPDDGVRLFTVHVRRGAPDVLDPRLHVHSKLNCVLACIQATKAGADEALMLDPHGFVSSCNSTNFFIVRKGEVWTSTGNHCLQGITRGNVIDLCERHGIPVRQRDFSLYEVYAADEAFVTGTFGGLAFVSEVDGRRIGDGAPGRGPMVRRLAQLYRDLLDEVCPPGPAA
jgi:branched-chain amino acid aminotransferase